MILFQPHNPLLDHGWTEDRKANVLRRLLNSLLWYSRAEHTAIVSSWQGLTCSANKSMEMNVRTEHTSIQKRVQANYTWEHRAIGQINSSCGPRYAHAMPISVCNACCAQYCICGWIRALGLQLASNSTGRIKARFKWLAERRLDRTFAYWKWD